MYFGGVFHFFFCRHILRILRCEREEKEWMLLSAVASLVQRVFKGQDSAGMSKLNTVQRIKWSLNRMAKNIYFTTKCQGWGSTSIILRGKRDPSVYLNTTSCYVGGKSLLDPMDGTRSIEILFLPQSYLARLTMNWCLTVSLWSCGQMFHTLRCEMSCLLSLHVPC